MGQAGDQPGGGAYIHALIEEAAYLQAHDEKPATIPPPPPDPAQFKCWFCRKPYQQVQTLFGAEYAVRGPQQLRQRDADLHLRRVRCQVRGVAGPGGTEDPRHAIGRRAGRDRPCRVRPANSVPGRGGLECRRHQRPNGTRRRLPRRVRGLPTMRWLPRMGLTYGQGWSALVPLSRLVA
jgi:hypothetical protein